MPTIFFHFLKIIFDINTSKRSKKYKTHSILTKIKNLKFNQTRIQRKAKQALNNPIPDQRPIHSILSKLFLRHGKNL